MPERRLRGGGAMHACLDAMQELRCMQCRLFGVVAQSHRILSSLMLSSIVHTPSPCRVHEFEFIDIREIRLRGQTCVCLPACKT